MVSLLISVAEMKSDTIFRALTVHVGFRRLAAAHES